MPRKRPSKTHGASRMTDLVAKHEETVILSVEDLGDAWDYVCDMFPRLSDVIRSTKIYKNNNTYFMRKAGFPPGTAGVFVKSRNAIILAYCRKFSPDVIAVHELLHYASRLIGSRQRNSLREEDLAYSKSIKYLLGKGYDEDWIVNEYLLPYFEGVEARKLKPGTRPSTVQKRKIKEMALVNSKSFFSKALKSGGS